MNATIQNLKTELDKKTTSPDTQFLAETLFRTTQDMTNKFIRGYEEHGGGITERPVLNEIQNEILDLIHYNAALKVKIERIIARLRHKQFLMNQTSKDTYEISFLDTIIEDLDNL